MLRSIFNVGLLAAGTALGQVLVFVLMPVLTRFVTPEIFGYFAVFLSFASIFSTVVSLGYEPAIVTQRTQRGAELLTAILLWIVLVSSFVVGIAMTVFASVFHVGIQSYYFLFLIPFCIFAGGYSVIYYIAMRHKQFKRLAAGNFNNGFAKMAVPLVMVIVAKATTFLLIIGDILGRVVTLFTLVSPREILRLMKLPFSHWRKGRKILLREKKYLLYFLPSNVVEVAVFWIPVPLFGLLYGGTEAGLMAFLIRLFSAAGTLVGKSLGDVYYTTARHFVGTYKLGIITGLIVVLLCLIMGTGWIIIYILGDAGFRFLFGSDWVGLGDLAIATAPILFLIGSSYVCSRYTLIIKKQEIRLVFYSICLTCILVLCACAATYNLPFYTTAHWFGYGGMIVSFWYFFVLLWIDITQVKNKIAKTAQTP